MLRATSHDASRKTRGQDGVAFSFLVGLFHSLQHAGLSRRTLINGVTSQVRTGTNFSDFPTSMIGPCQEAKSPPDALGRSAGVISSIPSARRVGLSAAVSIRG